METICFFIFVVMLKRGLFILLLFVSFVVNAQNERYLMLWNKNEVSIEPWQSLSISVAERKQYSPKSNTLNVVLGQLEIEHAPKSWLGYGAAMRISSLNLRNGNWITENRPFVFVNLNKDLNDFNLSFSNRIEYKSYKELEDHFRHKQTLKLNFPALAEWGMQFYLSEESFFKFNGAGTHLARFQSGVKALEKEWFAMKVYYMLEKTKAADTWLTGDILGVNLSFQI